MSSSSSVRSARDMVHVTFKATIWPPLCMAALGPLRHHHPPLHIPEGLLAEEGILAEKQLHRACTFIPFFSCISMMNRLATRLARL